MLDPLKDRQTQLFAPTLDERAMALHQEIEELSRRLHTIVDEATQAQCCEDDSGEELVPIRRSELKRLLDLASQSLDLVERSKLGWDRDDPVWNELGEEFKGKLLADLFSRADLSYSDCTRVLGKVCGGDFDDSDDSDDFDVELPDGAGAALVRAWIRSGGGCSAHDQWLAQVSWDGVPSRDASQALEIAVEHCLTAALVGHEDSYGLKFWLERVAPVVFHNPVERFEWLAEAVRLRLQEGHILGCAEVIRGLLWRWFCAIPKDDVRVVVRGLRTLDELAGSLDDSFEELSTCVAEAWPRFDWGAVPSETLSEVLREGVAHGLAGLEHGGRAEELAHWVGRVAPLVYPDLADRLLWFVEAVGKPAGDAPPFPDDVNSSLTEFVSAWLTELQGESLQDIAVVVRAFRRTAMSACVSRPDLDEDLDRLSEQL